MSSKKLCLVAIVFCVLIGSLSLLSAKEAAKSPATALPGRVPMASHLLPPSAEWNAYYDTIPEGERRLYWTNKVLVDSAREMLARMEKLEKALVELQEKVKVLEEKCACFDNFQPAEPTAVTTPCAAEPNE